MKTNIRDLKRKAELSDLNTNHSKVIIMDEKILAVLKIQRNWLHLRFNTTNRIIQSFLSRNLTIDFVKSISFESLVIFLREKPIIAIAKKCLQRVHILSTYTHGSPIESPVNVHIFLASYIIAYRPTHVFESMGTLEQELFEVAYPLTVKFENICNIIKSSKYHSFVEVPLELSKDFIIVLYEYLKRFQAWKVPDEAKLICRIKHALTALYQAQLHLPPDEPDDSKLKIEFNTQILRLRNKFRQISGIDALNIFDEQRNTNLLINRSDVFNDSNGICTSLPVKLSNEQLAHELLINPSFELNENGDCSNVNSVLTKIRESFHQAFWDSLIDDLKLDNPCYVRFLRVLSEIHDGINQLEAGSSISEVIDIDFIKQQLEHKAYNWNNCISLIKSIITIIIRFIALKRIEETKILWTKMETTMQKCEIVEQPSLLCKALEFLLARVNFMRIDAANARLRLISPVIKDHGIDYERGKFKAKLDNGTLTLDRTKIWFHNSIKKEIDLIFTNLDAISKGDKSYLNNIHSTAMFSLILEKSPITDTSCPETLLFDVHRLSSLQTNFKYLVSSAAILVTIKHYLRTTNNQKDNNILENISNFLTSQLSIDNIINELKISVSNSSLSEDSKNVLVSNVIKCVLPTDDVFKLINDRMHLYCIQTIKNNSPSNLQFVNTIQCLLPHINEMLTKLVSLSKLNYNIHFTTYSTIFDDKIAAIASGVVE